MKSSLSPRLLLTLVILGVGIALVAFAGVSYTSASADCASCHSEVATVSSAGTHSSLECVRCHAPSTPLGTLEFGAGVVLGMRVQAVDLAPTEITEIPNARCTDCHDMTAAGVVGDAIRINHEECVPNDTCVRCHDSVVHADDQRVISATDMFECLDCHTRETITLECDACHTGRLPQDRIKTGSFAVTHGKEWQKNHGLGSIVACAACHTDDDCGKCHGPGVPHGQYFSRDHGAYAQARGAKCDSCHQKEFCTSCHGMAMPHPAGFKEKHASVTALEGDDECKRCHAQSDCDTCHTMHVHPGGAIGTLDR